MYVCMFACVCLCPTLSLLLHPGVYLHPGLLCLGLEVHRLEVCLVVLPGFIEELLETFNRSPTRSVTQSISIIPIDGWKTGPGCGREVT